MEQSVSHRIQAHSTTITDRLRLELIDRPEPLARIADAWDELLLSTEYPIPSMSHAWVCSYLNYLLEDQAHWLCLLAWEGDRLAGVLPLVRCGERLSGISLMQLCTPHSPHIRSVDLVATPHDYAAVLQLFLDYLDQTHHHSWTLDLSKLTQRSPLVPLVGCGRAPYRAIFDAAGNGSYIDTTDDYDEYVASLSRKFVRSLRQDENRLQRAHIVEYESHTGRRNLHALLDEFLTLEDSGWKRTAGGSIRRSESLTYFYHQVASAFAARGWLDISFLRVDGTPIAGQLNAKVGRTFSGLKIAYDERFAKFSPGHLLAGRMMQRVFADPHIDEFNCFSDMAWHQNWRMKCRPYWDVSLYGRGVWPYVRAYLPKKSCLAIKKMPGTQTGHTLLKKLRSSER